MKRRVAGVPLRFRARARGSLMAVLALALGSAVPISLAPPAQAAQVIHVPADQPTIQAAINAASSGDTIEVAAGTYSEHIDFLGKSVELWASSGADSTVIDGSGATSGPVVLFSGGETSAAVLRGFTIANGPDDGVFVSNSSPTIVDNVIEGNTDSGLESGFASPLVQGNTIRDNGRSGIFGGGLYVRGESAATVLGNEITGNRAIDGAGILLFASGHARVEGNVIRGNTAGSQGGGMWIVNDSPALITQNLIVDNTASEAGGGVYWGVPSGASDPLRLVNNTVARNLAPRGSALLAGGYDEAVIVTNNVFSSASGSTVECDALYDPSPPSFRNNLSHAVSGPAWVGCDPTGADGNLSADPGFVDPSGSPGDFRVSPGSPAVDAGSNGAPGVPAVDLEGNHRIADGNRDAQALIDLGAYELNAPDAPVAPTAASAAGSATVTWGPPSTDGGWPITGYVVTPYVGFYGLAPTTFTSTATTQVVTGLSNGTTYRFRVQATNAVGTGSFSRVTNPVTPAAPTAPDAPMIGGATAGNRTATVSWTAPAADGGSPITGYVVTPYVGYWSGTPRVFSSTATTQTVTGLTNGGTYRFRVQAINAVGPSAYSRVTNPVTPTA